MPGAPRNRIGLGEGLGGARVARGGPALAESARESRAGSRSTRESRRLSIGWLRVNSFVLGWGISFGLRLVLVGRARYGLIPRGGEGSGRGGHILLSYALKVLTPPLAAPQEEKDSRGGAFQHGLANEGAICSFSRGLIML